MRLRQLLKAEDQNTPIILMVIWIMETTIPFTLHRTDTYEVRVVDENGCESIASIFMEFIDIEIPNFFTPDGDGNNDFWIPRNIEQFPEILIKIFDRYGRVVSEQSHDSEGWDGKYKE